MKTKAFLILFLLLLPFFSANAETTTEQNVTLPVPFTSQIPNGSWSKPWNNACEEASIIMTEGYYYGYSDIIPKKIAIDNIGSLFKIEDRVFGFNADTDAAHTALLINKYTDFSAKIVDNPSLDQIKNQIDIGRPVISFHYAKNLENKNHRWRTGSSYYHVMVLVGYDDFKQNFLVHDSGDPNTGNFYQYSYKGIMESLKDFNYKTKKASGVPRVLFTDSKLLYKSSDSSAVYLIRHNKKFPIADSQTFINNGWIWKNIQIVDQAKLNKYETAELIKS